MAEELPPGFQWADEPPKGELPLGFKWADEAPAAQMPMRPDPGALMPAVRAVGSAINRGGEHIEGLMTGRLEPTPENVLPVAASVINPAMRAGGLVRDAAMASTVPKYATGGPVTEKAAQVLSKIPIAGAPVRKAAERGIANIEARTDTISKLGRTPEGEFDPTTLFRNYEGLSAKEKGLMFGDPKGALRPHLESLIRDSEKIDSLRKIAARPDDWKRLGGATGIAKELAIRGAIKTYTPGAGTLARTLMGDRSLSKAALVGATLVEPTTTLTALLGARAFAKYISRPETAAPIAQWSRTYVRAMESGGTPAAAASLKIATNNLRNSLDEKFTDEDLIKAATQGDD